MRDNDRPGWVVARMREFYDAAPGSIGGDGASVGSGGAAPQRALALFHDAAVTVPAYGAVELAPGVRPDARYEQAIAASIRTELLRLNSEFAHYVPDGYQTPRIELRPAGDPRYFPPGVKHRYTRPPGNS